MIADCSGSGRLVVVGLLLMAGRVGAQEAETITLAQVWQTCTACHGTPDARIPQDADWLKLNLETTCLDIQGFEPTPEVRRALISYLRSNRVPRPVLIDAASRPAEGRAHGKVRVPATAGSAYLKPVVRGAADVRLHWSESEKGSVLAVPVGRYRVVNHAFYRSDDEERRWTLSGTSGKGVVALQVEKVGEAALALVPELRGKLGVVNDRGAHRVSFAAANARGDRMTVACNGRLTAPRWAVVDKRKGILERGDFTVS